MGQGNAYVGKYEMQGGMTVTITKEGDRLMGQPAGQPKVELLPESETKFYVRVVDAEVTFQRDQTGKVAQFTLSQGGLNTPQKKSNPLVPIRRPWRNMQAPTTATSWVRSIR